jgi:hypothetical protein
MMAPINARLYADWLCDGSKHPIFDRCRLSRFNGESREREEMIIG